MRQEIVPEEAFRTDDVVGAIVTAMGIVQNDKGGYSAFIETDDNGGLITYNLTVKGELAGVPDSKDISKWKIPGYLDFSKVNKAFLGLGYIPYIDLEINSWETEPPLVGKKVWIKRVKTSTASDGKEYFSHIDVVKIEDGGQPAQQSTQQPAKQEGNSQPQSKQQNSGLTDDLKERWTNILGDILSEGPLNEIEINTAVRKAFPDDATLRKQLADVRKPTLTALVNDGVLELDNDGKYQLAV